MKNFNQRIGNKGEEYAAEYLLSNGYEIVNNNYYEACGEIDIVAAKDDELIFVEVKTRSNEKFDFAEESVGEKKKNCLKKTIYRYLSASSYTGYIRIDLIYIILAKNNMIKSLQHIKDV